MNEETAGLNARIRDLASQTGSFTDLKAHVDRLTKQLHDKDEENVRLQAILQDLRIHIDVKQATPGTLPRQNFTKSSVFSDCAWASGPIDRSKLGLPGTAGLSGATSVKVTDQYGNVLNAKSQLVTPST
jgi:hypothetical protein